MERRILTERMAWNIFGNDNADDEDEHIFRSYVVAKSEMNDIRDPARRLMFVSAYKGMGKSALLRLLYLRIQDEQNAPLVIKVQGADLYPASESTNAQGWLRGWKKSIAQRIATEVGKGIGMAWSDDATGLVELAEQEGFKSRNIIGYIADRMGFKTTAKAKMGDEAGDTGAELSKRSLPSPNAEQVLKRWLNAERIWLIIDDTDKNFNGSSPDVERLIGLLDALRALSAEIPQLVIRASIRPGVWTILARSKESAANLRQYIFDLQWTVHDTRAMLARRIHSYYVRIGGWTLPLSPDHAFDQQGIIAVLFNDPVECMGRSRPPHVSLHTFSMHRPRWVIELSRSATIGAAQSHTAKVRQDDIAACLNEFGRLRLEDLIAEYSQSCTRLDEVFDAFYNSTEEMSTGELFSLINRKVLPNVNPRMPGIVGEVRARDVAAFLFRIGFYFARREHPDKTYDHFTFDQEPGLLRSETAPDKGMSWEIHPVFRQHLGIRDQFGRTKR